MVSKGIWGFMAISLLTMPLSAGSAESQPPKAAAPVKLFPILEYRVEGNTILAAIDVERAVTPYLGVGKSIKDVEAARLNLEKLYHERGYQTVLVNIPQQEVSDGVVHLQVVEAPIGHVQVKGSKYHSLQVINATIPELQPGVVPNFNEVQKELGAVNRGDELRVTPVLRASTTPGQVDVDLNVEDKLPLHAELEVNNRYSANTAHIRLIGEVSYDNLFQSNQSMSVQYQVAPEDPANAKIWAISYVIPSNSGSAFAFYYVNSNSNVASVGNLNVIGNGSIYGVRYIKQLTNGSATFYDNFTAGLDYKDFAQDVVQPGSGEIATPIQYAPFTLDYNATWLGPQDPNKPGRAATTNGRSSTNMDLGVHFLLGVFTNSTQFADKRAGASPNYIIFNPSVERQQVLPRDWSLDAKIGAQLASGPLINNEQYAIGGLESVRGYTESERLGDNGIDAQIELRTPQLFNARMAGATQLYEYLFADGGRVRILEPLPDQTANFHLASLGIGWRIKARGWTVDFDGARAMEQGYVTPKGDISVQFRVNKSW